MTIGSKSTSAVSAPSNDTKEECTKFVYVYVGSYSRAFPSDKSPPSSVDVDYSKAYDQLAAKEQSFLIKLLSDDSPYPTSTPSTWLNVTNARSSSVSQTKTKSIHLPIPMPATSMAPPLWPSWGSRCTGSGLGGAGIDGAQMPGWPPDVIDGAGTAG